MQVNIKMTGTDEGEFNYVLEEVVDGVPVGRLNYYGMSLSEGTTYSQELSISTLSEDITALPLSSETEAINANEYLSANDTDSFVVVTTECEGEGVVIGDGNYAKGDSVKLTSIPSSDYYAFVGWYVNNELVSTDAIYQFTAMEDVTIKAAFKEQFIIDKNYSVTMSSSYEDDLYVMVCKNESFSNDVIITSFEDAPLETLNIYCNAYSLTDEAIINNKQLSASYSENYTYKMTDVDFSNCYKIELTDENGIVIADIIRNVDDTDVYISNDVRNSIFISDSYIDADIELYNKSDEDKEVCCGIAAYSNDNSLIGISSTDITVNSNSSADFNLTVESDSNPHHIKVFVWDGLDTMIPITKAITIDNSDE